jgi:predicted RNA-binding Zn-ribbon protein involved in translation (DUF1610 family)
MAISFKCSNCGKKLKAPESAAGKSSTCPGCGNLVTCPAAAVEAGVVEMTIEPEKPAGVDPFVDLDGDQPYTMAVAPEHEEALTESRRPCPMCGETILATAAKCRFCGEVLDQTIKKVKKKGGKKAELKRIAVLQKFLLISILVMLVAYVGYMIAIGMTVASRPNPQAPPNLQGPMIAVIGLLFVVIMAASLAAWILSVLLANKLYGTGGAILVFFLQFVPCVNLITLLVVSNKATAMLRDKGLHVGLLGADLSDF